MTTFRYRAYGVDGGFAEGTVEATSPEAASAALWSQGLTPFQMRQADSSGTRWWNREISLSGGARRGDLLEFTRGFAMLNAAEIPLDDALRILQKQASSSRPRRLVDDLLAAVLNGTPLSDAMARQPKIFPVDYVAVVRAGEIGGTLNDVFVELADLLERRAEIQARIQSALIYPCMLIALSLGTLGIVIGGLIPALAPIFEQSGKPMPASIQFMLTLRDSWLEIILGAALAVASLGGASLIANRRPELRQAIDRGKLLLPVIGSFLRQREAARFSRTLGTLLKAGVPLIHAVRSACSVVANRQMAAGIERAIEDIQQGVAVHRALQKQAVLPGIALQMISVGEQAGKLDRMLTRVAILLERQIQSSIDRFMSALTPALTVGIALLVGALIMPVMNAVLSLNDLAAR